MTRRTFKDGALQTTYDWFLENDPAPETKGGGGAFNAYFVGRYRPNPARPFGVRGSLAYAAWAAGIDNARKAGEI